MSLILALSFLFSSIFLVSSSPQDEIRSLLEFKKGIQLDPLNKITDSWNISSISDLNSCPEAFYGVSCDKQSGSVVAIALDGLSLAGDIKFFTLTCLKMLANLSLSGNNFTGRLVPVLGSMYSLQHLDLSGNQFEGPIPSRIADLYGLKYLNLSNNRFRGGFPSGIRNLQQLKYLDLHSNELWGDVGQLIPELRNVEFVDLSYNSFYGSLGLDVQNVSSLANTVRYLNLSHNKLSGRFLGAEVVSLFRNLQVLDLGDNQLNGELPSFGSLPNLHVLRLSHNQLFGSIPEELLESLFSLQELDLSHNGFSGSIPKINSTSLNTPRHHHHHHHQQSSWSGQIPESMEARAWFLVYLTVVL